MSDALRTQFRRLAPAVDFCSLRFVEETSEQLSVRQDVLQPPSTNVDRGAMVTVIHRGGSGYAATSDLSETGLRDAFVRAQRWAELSAGRSVVDYRRIALPRASGTYTTPPSVQPPLPRKALIDLLMQESSRCRIDGRVVDWQASVWQIEAEQLYLTADGAEITQQFRHVIPNLAVTASDAADTQTRSLGGQYNGYCRQGGFEILEQSGFYGAGRRVAEEALALLAAPNCPSGVMDLLLMPEQMMLQIHESIGHPLELDRILGDERNFAGTSFVTPDMFGSYRYGSELLNVTYDPSRGEQFASYGWDDEGSRAERAFLIRAGMLERPLGSAVSQARSGLPGVANARACSWNRPPIDRMANLNIEPGDTPLEAMIRSVKRGVLMDTNVSWSIDDSRNKFQFGCEVGRLIEDGELKGLVKNPNYRGISATFWRSLKAVGDQSTFRVMGTPFCGKGEPSQVIRVGHASPACLFGGVDVFGGQ